MVEKYVVDVVGSFGHLSIMVFTAFGTTNARKESNKCIYIMTNIWINMFFILSSIQVIKDCSIIQLNRLEHRLLKYCSNIMNFSDTCICVI